MSLSEDRTQTERLGENQDEILLELTGDGQQRFEGKAFVKRWSNAERRVRALKFLGATWLIAIISIGIPVAHFVLVPLFLLLGPVVAFVIGRQRIKILGGVTTCVKCGQDSEVILVGGGWPKQDVCKSCGCSWIIRQKDLD